MAKYKRKMFKLRAWLMSHDPRTKIIASNVFYNYKGVTVKKKKMAAEWVKDDDLNRLKDAKGVKLIDAIYEPFGPMRTETVVARYMPDEKAEYHKYCFFMVQGDEVGKGLAFVSDEYDELEELRENDPQAYYEKLKGYTMEELRELRYQGGDNSGVIDDDDMHAPKPKGKK